jgi:protein-S-isoprenylcysteine O-methyltransferase Ste14
VLTYVAVAIVIVVYAALLRIPRRRRKTVEQRSTQSLIGMIVAGFGFAALFAGRPRQSRPFADSWHLAPGTVAVIAVACTVLGIVFIVWSRRTLGKQWSYSARVVEGHELITHGPYAVVRNPIYSSLTLILLSLGLTFATPLRVGIALVLYFAGTLLRVRAEEDLMRATFGEQWDAYRRRVPALIPFVRRA